MKVSILLLITLLSVSASAHQLPGSTATIVLRDGLVTVDANLDIAAWMRGQNVKKPRTLEATVASAKKEAATLTVLVNNRPVVMSLLEFPSVESVHRVLQRPAPKKGHGKHPKVVRVQWRAVRSMPKATSVTVRFPKAVGDVLVTFVEPRSKVVKPGGPARFKSRRTKNSQSPPRKK